MQLKTISGLKDGDKNTNTCMKAKETFVEKSAFSRPLPSYLEISITSLRLAYIKIVEEVVAPTLTIQAATEAPSPNKMNFQIVQMI